MKMAKKFLAVALAGVMALTMLTGCTSITNKKIANELEKMLGGKNTKATVSVTSDANDLASKAAKAIKGTDFTGVVTFSEDKDSEETKADGAVKKALDVEKITDKYVWAVCFETKNVKEKDQAQKAFDKVSDTKNALNTSNVKVTGATKVKAGDKYELGTSTFTKKNAEGKSVEYRLIVVTCKAVADTTEASE